MPSLSRHPQVIQLARALGILDSEDTVSAIVAYSIHRVDRFVDRYLGDITTLEGLKEVVADSLSVNIRYIWKNEDLLALVEEFGDAYLGLAQVLQAEFCDKQTEGLLLFNPSPEPWERKYLAIVDGRGTQVHRANYTSWHELAHVLVSPREDLEIGPVHLSSAEQNRKDPVEQLVDIVAGRIAFYDPIFRPIFLNEVGRQSLTFSMIERIRTKHIPEASLYSTVVACMRLSEEPMLLLKIEEVNERNDLQQLSHLPLSREFLATITRSKLKVVQRYPNDVARYSNMGICKGMSIPRDSVIYAAYEQQVGYEIEAAENRWDTGEGAPLHVRAILRGAYVYALVSPLR